MAFIKITDQLNDQQKKIINTDMICSIVKYPFGYRVYLSGDKSQYVGIDNIEIEKIFNVIGESLY